MEVRILKFFSSFFIKAVYLKHSNENYFQIFYLYKSAYSFEPSSNT